jgi:hypothetical protein
VGSVVCGDDINGAVRNGVYDGPPVLFGADGRIDFGQRPFADDSFLCQGEVVGGSLGVDSRIDLPGLTNQADPFFTADMLDAERGILFDGNLQISFDHGIFRFPAGAFQAEEGGSLTAAVDARLPDIGGIFFVE